MKRKVPVALATAMASILLTGCGGTGTSGGSAGEGQAPLSEGTFIMNLGTDPGTVHPYKTTGGTNRQIFAFSYDTLVSEMRQGGVDAVFTTLYEGRTAFYDSRVIPNRDKAIDLARLRESARKQNVPESTIAAIRDGHTRGVPAEDAKIIEFTRRLLREHRLDDATVAALRQRFGDKGLIELTGSIGYYAMLAMTVNACELPAAPGADALPGR